MDDYIKREDVKREAFDLDNNFVIDLCDVDLIPSADVAPVRHGKWIVLQQTSMPTMWNCRCSECGAYETKTPKYQANYCPNCGAKMDKGE